MKSKFRDAYVVAIALSLLLQAEWAKASEGLNPLDINTIDQLVSLILQAVITVGLPLLVFFFLLTGFYFVTAQGDTKKLGTAKDMLRYTIYGAALILGAKVIQEVLKNTISKLHV